MPTKTEDKQGRWRYPANGVDGMMKRSEMRDALHSLYRNDMWGDKDPEFATKLAFNQGVRAAMDKLNVYALTEADRRAEAKRFRQATGKSWRCLKGGCTD